MSTPEQLREEAAEAYRKREESWERSDTDGFLSQWALGLTAQLKNREADLLEAGGVAEFPGLFWRETGERVKAKIVQVRAYGSYTGQKVSKWIVLDEDDNALEWLPAYKGDSTRSKLYKLGYEERDETAPAKAEMMGGYNVYVGVRRTDRGYPDGARTIGQIVGES